ncbi:MAG: hypothetical protein RH949_06595 [Coleofasciculus sp. A1-SPW-01]|uniref:hypothetical protein n=1 Tax=Coleofasciculus sp. A1-SPW-01 TaxID=3070819 RepID=UPI00330044F8
MLQVIVPRKESRRQKIVGAGLGIVGAGLGTVGAGLGTVGAGLGTVGAGLGTVGAGLGTNASFLPITEQQNPPYLTDNGTIKSVRPHQ